MLDRIVELKNKVIANGQIPRYVLINEDEEQELMRELNIKYSSTVDGMVILEISINVIPWLISMLILPEIY